MFKRLFSRSRFDGTTHDLYDSIMAQARQPILYTDLGVPDTLDGRFDLVVLHGILAMRRLRRIETGGTRVAQAVFDIMFADFDRSLRDIGVGDLKVGKRIRQMAQAFYGRADSYGRALEGNDREALRDALERNLYGTSQATREMLDGAAGYVLAQEGHLAGLRDDDLLAGRLSFARPRLPAASDASI